MEFGERNNLLAKEQYGSRKGKSAIQHALNKRLVLDNIRLNKIPAIYCANDAKSCYDRILLMVAYLTMRQMNISDPHQQFTKDHAFDNTWGRYLELVQYTVMSKQSLLRKSFYPL